MIAFVILSTVAVSCVLIFLNHPQFGKLPLGERLEQIRMSPNFQNGAFQNLNSTPVIVEGASFHKVFKEFFVNKNKRLKPETVISSVKTNLAGLSRNTDVLIWFGHSSYFMQIGGKRILVDPVLCGSASPVKFTTRSFKGTDIYKPGEIPEIDYLFITHDHWDHLDYQTLRKLKPGIGKIITGLGVGSHLERWGFSKQQIIERDWYETVGLDPGFSVTITPARHFSGRLFKRNQSLWVSFVLNTPTIRIFMGGDGGYDTHFANIGNAYGPFDLAILECGQYNENWKYIHSMPGQVFAEAHDLQAVRILPVHWGKFRLSTHDWDEPIIRLTALAKNESIQLLTPLIGETLDLSVPVDHSLAPETDWFKTPTSI